MSCYAKGGTMSCYPSARLHPGRCASGSGRFVKPDASPTARALLALELVQDSPGDPGVVPDREVA